MLPEHRSPRNAVDTLSICFTDDSAIHALAVIVEILVWETCLTDELGRSQPVVHVARRERLFTDLMPSAPTKRSISSSELSSK